MPNACRNASLIALGLIALLELGCGGDSSSSGGSGGSTGSGGGAAGASGAGGSACPGAADPSAPTPTCNTVTNTATAIPFTAGTGSPPTFTGGTVIDGLYEAIKTEGFNWPSKNGRRASIVVQNGGRVFFWAGDLMDEAGTTVLASYRFKTTMTVAGNQITPAFDCTSGGASLTTMSFTASPTELVLASITGAGTAVTTYTRKGCP